MTFQRPRQLEILPATCWNPANEHCASIFAKARSDYSLMLRTSMAAGAWEASGCQIFQSTDSEGFAKVISPPLGIPLILPAFPFFRTQTCVGLPQKYLRHRLLPRPPNRFVYSQDCDVRNCFCHPDIRRL